MLDIFYLCFLLSTSFRYTRAFNLDLNTHLLCVTPSGPKYELATCSSSIHIVSPEWLEECSKQLKRIDEAAYKLSSSTAARSSSSSLKPPPQASASSTTTKTLSQELDTLLKEENYAYLFEYCVFYLIGFEQVSELKVQLSQLIRRNRGTIVWEMHPSVTHLILHESSSDSLR